MFALLACGAGTSVAPLKPSLLRLRGGAADQPKTGKVWHTSTFTRDHVRLAWELPSYLGAYVNPFTSIEPMGQRLIWASLRPQRTDEVSACAVHTCCVGSLCSKLPQATARHLRVPEGLTVQTHFMGRILFFPP